MKSNKQNEDILVTNDHYFRPKLKNNRHSLYFSVTDRYVSSSDIEVGILQEK